MKDVKYFVSWGITAFLVICGVLVFYDIVFQDSVLVYYGKRLVTILAPVGYGFLMAYILTPVVNWLERTLFKKATNLRFVRAGSITLTWLIVGISFYVLLSILLPQLYQSLLKLVENAEGYYDTFFTWIEKLLMDQPETARWLDTMAEQYYQEALNWVKDTLLPQASVAIGLVTGGVLGILNFVKDLLVGIIVSVYLLATKEGFAATGCKLTYSLLRQDHAAFFIRGVKEVNRIFSGFFRGKILDSIIIGILCFIGCGILDMPYTPLVAVVVGVTNVIPFFGPFLGAIPCAFLILLDSPVKCLYFVIFIIVLQQFDGNILGPYILGDSTGISSFWVIVAILVGGGLWGVWGMFVGVPLFACIYSALRKFTGYLLSQKGLPQDSKSYQTHAPVWPSSSLKGDSHGNQEENHTSGSPQ